MHCQCKVEGPTRFVHAKCYPHHAESRRTWKVSHSSTNRRNESSMSPFSCHEKPSTSTVYPQCDFSVAHRVVPQKGFSPTLPIAAIRSFPVC